MASVDIAICTFRRPFLAETLRSVAALEIDNDTLVRVIVSDNDVTPSAQGLVQAIARDFPFPVMYLHSPAQNISIARNACLDAASAEYLAFIDDDETVSPQWLGQLLNRAETTGADAVLGPVRAVYADTAPQWMARGDFHSTAPVVVNGRILTGYTCNVLMRRTPALSGLRFDLALGRSGGEDTDFFHRFTHKGGSIVSAPEAWVYEPVPESRAAMSWLMRRKLRSGQTHGMLLGGARLPQAGIAAAKAGYCFAMAGLTAFSPIERRKNLLRAVLHLGVIGGIFGVGQAVHYGDAPAR